MKLGEMYQRNRTWVREVPARLYEAVLNRKITDYPLAEDMHGNEHGHRDITKILPDDKIVLRNSEDPSKPAIMCDALSVNIGQLERLVAPYISDMPDGALKRGMVAFAATLDHLCSYDPKQEVISVHLGVPVLVSANPYK